MRYHYGLGVGHTYAHSHASTSSIHEADLQTLDGEEVDLSCSNAGLEPEEEGSDSEFDLEDLDSSDDSYGDNMDLDDEELLAMEEMYGN